MKDGGENEMLKDCEMTDSNGNFHKRFVVRAFGRGLGYGILDLSTDTFIYKFAKGVTGKFARQLFVKVSVNDYNTWAAAEMVKAAAAGDPGEPGNKEA